MSLTCMLSCVKKTRQQNSLPRATKVEQLSSACPSVLPAAEFRMLSAQLTSASPLGIVSTNDLHGHTDARTFQLNLPGAAARTIKAGGFELMAAYLAALCRHYKGRLLFIDAGDSYQGTLISNSSSGQVVLELFSSLGLAVSTFGNHEFDFGQVRIRDWLASPQRQFWYVTSSLSTAENGRQIPWTDLNASRFARSVVLDVAGVKVGIAGYTTESTAVKSIPSNVSGVAFQRIQDVLAQEGKPLRAHGAQVVLLLSHSGGSCDMLQPAEQGDMACPQSQSDELGQALRSTPSARDDWQLVVAGHSHKAQRHFIAGVPVTQTTGLGLSLAHARVDFSGQSASVKLHDPIFLCERHFEGWAGCHPDEFAWRQNNQTPLGRELEPTVMGQPVRTSDSGQASTILNRYRESLKKQMEQKITVWPTDLSHNRTGASPAAACLADAWLRGIQNSGEIWGQTSSADVEVAALNAGALRSGLTAGDLTFARLFEVLPYDNTAHIVHLTRDELLAFARAQEESPHDYLFVSEGFAIQRKANDQSAPRTNAILTSGRMDKSATETYSVALTTYSKTFVEKAGLKKNIIDSGLSVRATIAETLQKNARDIRSCMSPDAGRMQIVP
jgi:5'-nucleotidase